MKGDVSVVGEAKSGNVFLKNVIIVLVSNVISLLSGVLIGFIIPKILGVSEYGYYKTFTLYSSYIGILHFGFIDGLYFKFAGKEYRELDKRAFRSFTFFLFCMELTCSVLFVLASLFFLGTSYFVVVLFVGVNILATNMVSYYEFVTQAIMRFKRITLRNVIKCSLNIISVFALFVIYHVVGDVITSSIYIAVVLAINYGLLFWYVFTYRELTFGEKKRFAEIQDDLRSFFKIGIPLLFSNLVARLIFLVDQQFVNIGFDNITYSSYAFAYNMISLISIATSAVSTVLYPTLRTIDEKTITTNYSKLNSYLLIFVSFCLLSYFPLVLIVKFFLPQYSSSLSTFVIILPGVLISSSVSVIKHNCYKTLGKIGNYFWKSLIVLTVAVCANFIAYFAFGTTESISIVSIFVLALWYFLAEAFFVKAYKVSWAKNALYIFLIVSGFYCCALIPNTLLSMLAFFLLYSAITMALFFKDIRYFFTKFILKK